MVLVIALALTLCPAAFADGLVPSDEIVAFIEDYEGYRQYAYSDAGGWYIGYGVKCGENDYPDGMTVEEADALLREVLADYAEEVNNFAAAYKITLSQNQFDALLSFTYNCGGGWMRGGNRVFTYLTNGIENYSDVEIVDAMGVWSHQGTKPVAGLIARRINEARIFLYGDYEGKSSPDFCYLMVDRNGGELENDVFCYEMGKPYGTLPQPTLEGYRFAGWETYDGKKLTSTETVTKSRAVTATWKEAAAVDFEDVAAEHPYYDAIAFCYQNGIMTGMTETTFAPEKSLNRAMVVTVLWRLAGEPIVDYEITFADVEAGEWYTEAVRWASSVGVVTGYSAKKFGTYDSVTRQQLATFMYRFGANNGADMNTWDMTLDEYADASKVSEYAYDPMCWVLINNMLTSTEGNLAPATAATRGETAQALMMYLLLY